MELKGRGITLFRLCFFSLWVPILSIKGAWCTVNEGSKKCKMTIFGNVMNKSIGKTAALFITWAQTFWTPKVVRRVK